MKTCKLARDENNNIGIKQKIGIMLKKNLNTDTDVALKRQLFEFSQLNGDCING